MTFVLYGRSCYINYLFVLKTMPMRILSAEQQKKNNVACKAWQAKQTGLGHRKVTWRHTKVKVWRHKKWHAPFLFDRPPSWKCQSNRTGFRTSPSPEWKKANQQVSVQFRHLLSSYRVKVTSCNLCVRAGQSQRARLERELKTEQNPSLVKLVEGF